MLKPKRLLLVDDNVRNLVALEACLAPFGFQIVTATSGKEALIKFESTLPDLILLDVKLPDISGIDVLRRIRAHETLSQTPTILLTAYAEQDLRLQGLDAAADEFLQKPFDIAILQARVKTLLWLKESRDELALRNAALVRMQRQQRELIDLIVHDLKAPLSVMSVNVDWVSEQLATDMEAVQAPMREALEQAASAGQRMKSLINDLLSIARLDQGAITMRIEAVPLSGIFETALRRYAIALQRRGITSRVMQAINTEVEADAELLQRAFDNLFENVMNVTPASGTLEISVREHSQVEIMLESSGPCLSSSERARIFDKFSEHGATGADAGVGLYFCSRIADALRGSVEVVDAQGGRLAFRMCLPAFHDRESGAFTRYPDRDEGAHG